MKPKQIDEVLYKGELVDQKYVDRLLNEKVQKGSTESDCWHWLGSSTTSTPFYGIGKSPTTGKYRVVPAQRLIYFIYFGDKTHQLQIRRACGNTFCLNPLHLRAEAPRSPNG